MLVCCGWDSFAHVAVCYLFELTQAQETKTIIEWLACCGIPQLPSTLAIDGSIEQSKTVVLPHESGCTCSTFFKKRNRVSWR
jgi:hypothetical protein